MVGAIVPYALDNTSPLVRPQSIAVLLYVFDRWLGVVIHHYTFGIGPIDKYSVAMHLYTTFEWQYIPYILGERFNTDSHLLVILSYISVWYLIGRCAVSW